MLPWFQGARHGGKFSCVWSMRAIRVRRPCLHYFIVSEAIFEECYLVVEAFTQHVLGDYVYTTLLWQRRLEMNVYFRLFIALAFDDERGMLSWCQGARRGGMLSCFSSIRATRVRRLCLHYLTLTAAIRDECYLVSQAFAQHVLGDYFYTTLLWQRRLERNATLTPRR